MINKLIFAILTAMMLFSPISWGGNYEILPCFPTEAQMDTQDFALVSPKQMMVHNDRIYVLDQAEHGVHIFTKDGAWLKIFGAYGDGPGEMIWPHFASISEKGIMIADQSSLLHFFDLEGNYQDRKRVIDFFYRFVDTSQGLFMLTLGNSTLRNMRKRA